jgi:predicted CoA-substrate-specific enzyme activase
MIVAGVDAGSLSAEAALIDEKGNVIAQSVVLMGGCSPKASEEALKVALKEVTLSLDDLSYIVATGCGREISPHANARVTEITCIARGAFSLYPSCRTVIDIGGQDTKVIRINERGIVAEFDMNDKCAAGTGRFLEVMANAMGVSLEEMGQLSLEFKEDLQISSVCTVFAESEVLSLQSQGKEVNDILRGIHKAIADRTVGLLERIGVEKDVVMTGGVAKNIGVVRAIEEKLGLQLIIPEEPQTVGAIGAANIALQKARAK